MADATLRVLDPMIDRWYAFHVTRKPGEPNVFDFDDASWLAQRCPCGVTIVFKSAAQIPLVDTPFPCGNPKHQLITYTEEA